MKTWRKAKEFTFLLYIRQPLKNNNHKTANIQRYKAFFILQTIYQKNTHANIKRQQETACMGPIPMDYID